MSLTYEDCLVRGSQFQGAELAVQGKASVKDCRFELSSLYSLNPSYCQLSGNTFTTSAGYDAVLTFLTDQTDFVVKGLVCKDNHWSDEGAGRVAYVALDKAGTG